MELTEVSRLHRRWDQKGFKRGTIEERFQTGQEISLIAALASASKVTPSQQIDLPPIDAPPVGDGYVWVRQDTLGGLFRLIRQGRTTTATSLIDRELPVEDQVTALEAIDWVPQAILPPIIKATAEGTTGKLWVPELPGGRVASPFPHIHFQLYLGGENDHPVRRYFWPAFSKTGELCLDHGEQVSHSWTPSASQISSHKVSEPNGIGSPLTPALVLDQRAYLTDYRLVSCARRDPSGIEPNDERLWCASHYRWDWIYEVGIARITKFKRTGMLAKKIPVEETEGLYARLRLASGVIFEIHFPERTDQTAAYRELVDRCVQLIIGSGADREIQPETHSSNDLAFATIVRTAVPISGAVPYSLPEQLLQPHGS
jgi:hypothetical protein